MRDKLTKKQRGFVKDYIKTGNGTKAALNNYDIESDSPETVASAISTENLSKPLIQNAIQEALPDELLAQVHLDGLAATKRSGTGGMKIGIGTDGKVNDFGHTEIDEPDFAVRHKYLDSAYKLKGLYAPEKSLIVTVDIEANDEIKKLAEQLNEFNRTGTKNIPGDGALPRIVGEEVQD